MLTVTQLVYDLQDKPLLQNINFTLLPGQILHLCGENGKGKSTLLRILAGLIAPLSGQITLNAFDLLTQTHVYQQQTLYIGHKSGLNALLTVAEHCRFHLNCSETEIVSLLTQTGLIHQSGELIMHLSAGQQRRLSLLRLLVSKASLWLLDEPLSALDSAAVTRTMHMVNNHAAAGGITIITSHQALPLAADAYQEYWLC